MYVPSLPGFISEGDTEEAVMENIREAIELYLKQVDDDSLPGEKVKDFVEEIAVYEEPAICDDRAEGQWRRER